MVHFKCNFFDRYVYCSDGANAEKVNIHVIVNMLKVIGLFSEIHD